MPADAALRSSVFHFADEGGTVQILQVRDRCDTELTGYAEQSGRILKLPGRSGETRCCNLPRHPDLLHLSSEIIKGRRGLCELHLAQKDSVEFARHC